MAVTLSPGAGALPSWTQTLYVATIPSLTAQCPTPGGNTYTAIPGATLDGNATSFSDATETPGNVICEIDQESFASPACKGGTCYSGYSPASAPFQVPALPTTPGTPIPGVSTAMLAPAKRENPHAPTMAAVAKPGTPILSAHGL